MSGSFYDSEDVVARESIVMGAECRMVESQRFADGMLVVQYEYQRQFDHPTNWSGIPTIMRIERRWVVVVDGEHHVASGYVTLLGGRDA